MNTPRCFAFQKRNPYLCMVLFLTVSALAVPDLPSISDPLYLQPIANPDSIAKFVNPLPVVKLLGLRVDAVANPNLTIRMAPTAQDVLGTGQMTVVWGYGIEGITQPTYPGPTLVAKKDVPVTITCLNNLGFSHPLPMDTSIMWSFSMAPYTGQTFATNGVPAVMHLHGGHTDSDYDGLPDEWFTPLFHTTGSSLSKGPGFKTNIYAYENSQEAGTLWYHDHALGLTRLNTYMGLAGFYFVRDDNELNLITGKQIPSGDYEIEMAIQDRMFYPDGQLAFPNTPTLPGLRADQTIRPEFFGEVILVNGKAWPFLDVEPRKYRFRILNGSDSRFYNIWLDAGAAGTKVPFTQIGSDGGLLPSPVTRDTMLIGCGERVDVVIDFSNSELLGKSIVMRNNAAVPFPDGDNIDSNTCRIMQFRVGSSPVVDSVALPDTLRPAIPPLVQTGPTRRLLLTEVEDELGRTTPMLGTVSGGKLAFMDSVTEKITLNDVEVWEVYNATIDAHPIHLHLVEFQVIDHQEFTATQNDETKALSDIQLVGSPQTPPPEQKGWKDTEIMLPGEVTRIKAKFDKPGRYVWHCHILSHEEHDMMRPMLVTGDANQVKANRLAPQGPLSVHVVQNPFNPSTFISFTLPVKSRVVMAIYNVNGRQVAKLVDGDREAGRLQVTWNVSGMKSGTYFCRIHANGFPATKKILLLR